MVVITVFVAVFCSAFLFTLFCPTAAARSGKSPSPASATSNAGFVQWFGIKEKRRSVVGLLAIATLTLILIMHFRSDLRFHNSILADLEGSLAAFSLPDGAHRIKNASIYVGRGNGNNCDFIAAEVHGTKGTPEEVVNHYRQSDFRIARPPGEGAKTIRWLWPKVAFFEGAVPPDLDISSTFDLHVEPPDDELLYVVYMEFGSFRAGDDMRCH